LRSPRVDTTILDTTLLLTLALGGVAAEQLAASPAVPVTDEEARALVGVWLNADRTVRLHLAEDWSYVGSVAGRHRGAKGIYRPGGAGLLLCDETGLRTPVAVLEHGLEMAGHQLFPG